MIQPTVNFNIQPHCKKCTCFCCVGDDEERIFMPNESGIFKPISKMTDQEVEKANERFREIIIRKIDPLPLDNDEFLQVLEDQGISLSVSRDNPITKVRLDRTVKKINEILADFKVN